MSKKQTKKDSQTPNENFEQENIATEELETPENGSTKTDPESPEEVETEEDTATQDAVPAEQLEALQEEYDKLQDKYLRLAAEFENYKKRMNRDLTRRVEFANEELLREFLPIMDDLERTVQAVEDDSGEEHLRKGIELVYNNFKNILKRRGVEPIDSVGEPFDPELHEAVMTMESDEHDSNTVTQEFERGYQLGEKVLRHAKVVVSK